MTTPTSKLCPIRLLSPAQNGSECLKERCAWWVDKPFCECAMVNIPGALQASYNSLETSRLSRHEYGE